MMTVLAHWFVMTVIVILSEAKDLPGKQFALISSSNAH
jgi:hypothetical protein